jgi:ATP-dependent HslUV protease ATP-binding subunit HslU
MENLTPKQIVAELDRYIVGQADAKKVAAISLRNRWRRSKVEGLLRDEIIPKNILMVGPTGVGKTEIARRLAKLVQAPFIKVEATKFTEVGYVGRDVESIIRELTEESIQIQREKQREKVKGEAEKNVEKKILDALVGSEASPETRLKYSQMLTKGELDKKEIEIHVSSNNSAPPVDLTGIPGGSMGVINLSDMLNKAIGPNKKKLRKMTVEDARKALLSEESETLSDEEQIIKEALDSVENEGIVFIDEIDKIVVSNGSSGREVSREGVQRDLLPLLEGTNVITKYGTVKTDHILFLASGAFHLAKPSDLLPELQGRLPVRVELNALTDKDMYRILTEPEASLPKQYAALLATEGVKLHFTADGLHKLASLASEINKEVENIGARRLQTIMEKLLEDVSYNADERSGETIEINEKYVEDNIEIAHLNNLGDLSKFIL